MKKQHYPANPFPTSGYYGPEFFCDRVNESNRILNLIKNGESCLLMGNRRLGKTALIRHVQHLLPKQYGFIYLDILPTEKETQFLNALSNALIHYFPEESKFGAKVWKFIKGLHPTLSFDQFTGIPQISFQHSQVEKPVRDILEFLSNLDFPIVIAIDEFQQIALYPESTTDAWLRAAIQQLKNVTFIFSGSRHSILNDLFTNPARPFFKSATPLKLEKIDKSEYKVFILKHFSRASKLIDDSLVDTVLEWTSSYTYYTQLVCNRLFQLPVSEYSEEDWNQCSSGILQENEPFFIHYRTLLSPQQWKLLVAIAQANAAYEPTSKDFVSKYDLGSPATVLRSLESLLDKQMILKEYDQESKVFYQVYDVLFARWIQRVRPI